MDKQSTPGEAEHEALSASLQGIPTRRYEKSCLPPVCLPPCLCLTDVSFVSFRTVLSRCVSFGFVSVRLFPYRVASWLVLLCSAVGSFHFVSFSFRFKAATAKRAWNLVVFVSLPVLFEPVACSLFDFVSFVSCGFFFFIIVPFVVSCSFSFPVLCPCSLSFSFAVLVALACSGPFSFKTNNAVHLRRPVLRAQSSPEIRQYWIRNVRYIFICLRPLSQPPTHTKEKMRASGLAF